MSGRTDDPGAALRARAARLNAAVVAGRRSLAAVEIDAGDLPDRDTALLRSLLFESLRWHHRVSLQLTWLLDRPLRQRDQGLGALLRIGLTQLTRLRIPDHAAVSATVAATALLGRPNARGLVNAVLRRYLREKQRLEDRADADEVGRFSHPRWLIDGLREDWPDRVETILAANNAPPPMSLRVNRQRTTREDYLAELGSQGIEAAAGAGSEDAVVLATPRPVGALPGFDAGCVSVQDTAAQRAAHLMQLAPGQRVLDACAAPGGKSAHMRELCPSLAELVALDNDPVRLERMARDLGRLGLAATLVAGDALKPDQWFTGAPFDRILVDAPCSATGVIRRHPDIKVLRRADDIGPLALRQRRMLDALWPLLERNGRMVYSTCSVLKEENQRVVDAFVRETPDARVEHLGTPTHFQLLPGETEADGFYYACLSRDQAERSGGSSSGR